MDRRAFNLYRTRSFTPNSTFSAFPLFTSFTILRLFLSRQARLIPSTLRLVPHIPARFFHSSPQLKMPPKKRAAKAASPPAEDPGSDTPAPAKKPKAAAKKGPVTPLDPSIPHNTAFPDSLEFDRPVEGAVRIAMWNVAGIRACAKKVSLEG